MPHMLLEFHVDDTADDREDTLVNPIAPPLYPAALSPQCRETTSTTLTPPQSQCMHMLFHSICAQVIVVSTKHCHYVLQDEVLLPMTLLSPTLVCIKRFKFAAG
jgi:hypothetical protein